MGESCKDCRKWEEEMYWTHFQSLHFCQFLLGDYFEQLTIPRKFVNNLKDKLPETVTLKGPSGVTWNVGLTTNGDALVFKHGWKEFVEDHSLEENDVLIFRYDGNSRFDVLMFDRGSLCEREHSYFVRKCGHTKLDNGCQTMRKMRESSVEVVHASPHDDFINDVIHDVIHASLHDDVGCTPSGQGNISRANRKIRKEAHGIEALQANLRSRSSDPPTCTAEEDVNSGRLMRTFDDVGCTSSGKGNISQSNRKIRKEADHIEPLRAKLRSRSSDPPTYTAGEDVNSDPEQNSINRNGTYQLQYISNRRPVTEEEKEKALQMAQAASTSDGFIVVMRPTHVYKRFFTAIPSEWVANHLSSQNQDVILRFKENTWRARYYHSTRGGRRGGGGLTCGWKDFAVENNLEEFDVCVFEIASPVDNTVVLDVSIYRVVQEVIPPTRVNPPSSSRGRPPKNAKRKLQI